MVVSVGDQTILAKSAPELRALRPPTWHSQLAIVVPLPAGASTVRIAKPSQAGTIMPTAGLLLDV